MADLDTLSQRILNLTPSRDIDDRTDRAHLYFQGHQDARHEIAALVEQELKDALQELKRLRVAVDNAYDLAVDAEVAAGGWNHTPRDDKALFRILIRLIAWLKRDKLPEWDDRCDRALMSKGPPSVSGL